jgi:hypothetical protein
MTREPPPLTDAEQPSAGAWWELEIRFGVTCPHTYPARSPLVGERAGRVMSRRAGHQQ